MRSLLCWLKTLNFYNIVTFVVCCFVCCQCILFDLDMHGCAWDVFMSLRKKGFQCFHFLEYMNKGLKDFHCFWKQQFLFFYYFVLYFKSEMEPLLMHCACFDNILHQYFNTLSSGSPWVAGVILGETRYHYHLLSIKVEIIEHTLLVK